jgi:hypothetical protein
VSDQPNIEPQPPSAAALRDTRWLAGGMWGALLLALLVTSWAALRTGGSAIDLSLFSVFFFGDQASDPNRDLAAAASLVITAAIALALVAAWWIFARATQGLLAALADASDGNDDEATPGIWLVEDGRRSPLSDLGTYFGVTWALIIMRPAVIVSIQVFTS